MCDFYNFYWHLAERVHKYVGNMYRDKVCIFLKWERMQNFKLLLVSIVCPNIRKFANFAKKF